MEFVNTIMENYTFHGRVKRAPYIATTVGFWILAVIGLAMASFIPEYLTTASAAAGTIVLIAGFAFAVFAAMYVIFFAFQTYRRLHDIGLTGWIWPLAFLVVPAGGILLPVGILFEIFLFFPATATDEKRTYKEKPDRNVPTPV
ncbi:DUF805 domain-containing protein [Methanimicrococcus blatticola]|uniref:Uncharacterized membrane protein YhaH (DUF805 family) n=1 Tax=Methanimicrococcus blatticola TaxID=91560 RepID=A0A484F8E9_9EURY|nr:DUF805 domain-containing protein [Methanimicrococcus blatticola]MBZ3935066.1 DUF805 domain-containing protein [Methanimicrococcus blatticola]MCC2508837.1 DUF805 domain-containing protein [Methanimicrococcus blatticola]TDQ71136.1 uncharacterized membrane protein YhaH (DUF805 family) [Methanimicrococcus blatticola]